MRSNVAALYVIGFLDLFAVSMTIPLLINHCKNLGATPFLAGLIGSTYGFIQFFSGPLVGKCSDHYGRKFVLQICFLMSALSYLMLSASVTLLIAFFSRIPAGIFKHSQEISRSFLATSVKVHERSEIFGRFNAISNVGFVLGPLIAGHLVNTSSGFHLVAAITSLIFFINLALVTILLEEKRHSQCREFPNALVFFRKCINRRFLSRFWAILLVRFLLSFAVFVYRYDPVSVHGAKKVGWISSFSGVVSALSGFFIGSLVSLYSGNEKQLLLHLSVTQGVSILFLTVFSDLWPQLLFNIPFSIANSIIRVISTNMTLDLARKGDTGLVMGVGSSTIAIGRFLSPLAGGISQEVCVFGPSVLGSVSSFVCAMIVFKIICRQKND